MTVRKGQWRGRRVLLALLVMVSAVAVVASAVFLSTGSEDAGSRWTADARTTDGTDHLPLLTLPDSADVLVFGDSWTVGFGLDAVSDGYAYQVGPAMGWQVTVDGSGGTGYVNPGPGGVGTYATRLVTAATDPPPALVVLQGGLNDARLDLGELPSAAAATVAVAQARFPGAQLVVFGPGTDTWPVDDRVEQADRILERVAAAAGVHYVSPIQEEWITATNFTEVIDPMTRHPSEEGHALLARRLTEDLRALLRG